MVVAMRAFLKSVTGLSSAAVLALAVAGLMSYGQRAEAAQPLELAQTPESGSTITPEQPGNLSTTSLSLAGASRQMAQAEAAIANQDFVTAEAELRAARETLNQISTYYQELAQMFVGVDTGINRSNREQALEAAQMRDQATYQLALVHRAQNRPDQAVPLLMEILRSQQPTRDLGQRAYQQLFELGFVREPYAGRAATTPTTPSAE